MKLCIDSADTAAVRRLAELYPIDGVSTNPTILSRAGRPPKDVLLELRGLLGPDAELFVQALGPDADTMLREARSICRLLGDRTVVKLPCVPEGFRAMKLIRRDGIRLLGTAVYTVEQGLMGAACGCEYIAPYVSRIDRMGGSGVKTAKDIHDGIAANGWDSGLLAASFKQPEQIVPLLQYGIRGITLPPDMFDVLFRKPEVEAAVEQFRIDFEALAGPGGNMEEALKEQDPDAIK